jgi:hypothetical protein
MLYVRKVYQNPPLSSRLSQRFLGQPVVRRSQTSLTDPTSGSAPKPAGKKAWGAKGDLDLGLMEQPAKERR